LVYWDSTTAELAMKWHFAEQDYDISQVSNKRNLTCRLIEKKSWARVPCSAEQE